MADIMGSGGSDQIANVVTNIVTQLAASNQNMSRLIQAIGGIGGTSSVESAVIAASAVALTTATAANITSFQLTAGAWDVSAIGYFAGAASTNITRLTLGISTSSASLGGNVSGNYAEAYYGSGGIVPTASFTPSVAIPPYRVTLTTTTTLYLVMAATFTVSTAAGFGRIYARPAGSGA